MQQPLVVILGAGRPFSGTEPSALRKTSGDRRVLDWLIDAFTSSLEYPEIHFSRNEDWEETGTIGSLLSAPLDESRPTYICYADVVFQPDIVAELQSSSNDAAPAVDEH